MLKNNKNYLSETKKILQIKQKLSNKKKKNKFFLNYLINKVGNWTFEIKKVKPSHIKIKIKKK